MAIGFEGLRDCIGRQAEACDAVTPDLVRRFNATFDITGEDPVVGEPAPLGIHFCLAPVMVPTAGLGIDGHPAAAGFLPQVPLPRRMWAGSDLAFFTELRIGDPVRRVSTIADVTVKEGRSGPLCFIAVDHEIETSGRVILRERQNLVFLDIGSAGGADTPADPGDRETAVAVSELLLFRYSALTFNSHLIHYDYRYCLEKEGYPGLVVHGPLQATLLLRFASAYHDGRVPAFFKFRSHSAIYLESPILLRGRRAGDVVDCWTCVPGGPAAMIASATWK